MKRVIGAMVGVAVVAATAAAWTGAAPQQRPRLPALPAEVKARGFWEMGVKCDFPPFGYINTRNRVAGYDVDVARRFAELAFGRKSKLKTTCVTTPSRIPTLQQKRVDIIISTLTWTAAREEVIDYSLPYYNATGRLLVPNQTSITTLRSLNGKGIVTTRGSIYDRWIRNCFRDARLSVVDSPVAAVEVLKQGRADAFMFDDTFLLGVAANERNYRMTTHKFLAVPYGIGIRKGETAMKRWVDAAIRHMKRQDEFWPILQRNSPRRFWKFFRTNVPRPNTREAYPRANPPENSCP